MDAGFRRSGRIVYQPVCERCRACVPIRVPVATFAPSKSQRRCQRRNADLIVEVGDLLPSAEKFELYRRYIADRHMEKDASYESFCDFLYDSPIPTLEFSYRTSDGRLVAVGICDRRRSVLSRVYFYVDPTEGRRSLGTFGALTEIAFARAHEMAFYYLGYWIKACDAMRYKSDFAPFELLGSDGNWHAVGDSGLQDL
jgi:arginine-tRNA-protein transferase